MTRRSAATHSGSSTAARSITRNQGVLAAVISSSGPHEAESLEDVCQAVAQQLTDDLRLPAPLDARAIADRRATLAAVPHLHRPPNRTPWPGFAIAGTGPSPTIHRRSKRRCAVAALPHVRY